MYKIPKKSYTAEFKQEAVRQVEQEGKKPAQVARELGIAEPTLTKRGIPASLERVKRLMRENGIRAKHKRRYKATTDSKHVLPVAPDLLERQFKTGAPDQVWTARTSRTSRRAKAGCIWPW